VLEIIRHNPDNRFLQCAPAVEADCLVAANTQVASLTPSISPNTNRGYGSCNVSLWTCLRVRFEQGYERMSKTFVMTLRLPEEVGQGLVRLAARFGHKPAQIGARLVEEGLRHRDFPLIELRETTAGRIAYVKGTRFTVLWVAQAIGEGLSAEQFAQDFDLSPAQVRAALAYAKAFPKEIDAEAEHAAANQRWIEQQDAAWRTGYQPVREAKSQAKRKAWR
jgi:uncharacterized protein (DUF433 family)